jgi:hypothetical protein
MEKEKERNRGKAIKILAVIGTLLAWIPIAFTVFTSVAGTIITGEFHFDYLMPAELGLIAFAGALLLLFAAVRSRRSIKAIGVSSVLALFFIAASMTIASVSGMASGERAAEGMPFYCAVAGLILYSVSLIGIGIGGIRLCGDLFRSKKS